MVTQQMLSCKELGVSPVIITYIIVETKYSTNYKSQFFSITVTGFAERGLIHSSNFSTLRRCNSAELQL